MKRIFWWAFCVAALIALLALVGIDGASAQNETVRAARFTFTTGPCTMRSGSGSPEGVVVGNPCDRWHRTDSPFSIFTKTSGVGNTGWTLLASTDLTDTANLARLNAANVFSSATPLTTPATSWIGPSDADGINFLSGQVIIGDSPLTGKLSIYNPDTAANIPALRVFNADPSGLAYTAMFTGGTVYVDAVFEALQTANITGLLTANGGIAVDTSNFTVSGTTGAVSAPGGITGALTGNASTATALQTARTIAGVSFNGTANIAIPSTGLSDTTNLARLNAFNLFTNLNTISASDGGAVLSVTNTGAGSGIVVSGGGYAVSATASAGPGLSVIGTTYDITAFGPKSYFAGNVGIGSTAPLSKLSINGGLHVGGDSDAGDDNALIDGTLGVTGATTLTGSLAANGGIAVDTTNFTVSGTTGAIATTAVAALTTAAESWVGPSTTNGVYFKGGNVGIGTTNPLSKFIVSNGGAAGIEFDGASGTIFTYNRSGAAYAPLIFSGSTHDFNIAGAASAFSINASSQGSFVNNLGVGDTTPDAKLEVAGGDIGISTQGNGLILKATDGATCYRVTVNNAGTLATASVTCP